MVIVLQNTSAHDREREPSTDCPAGSWFAASRV